MKPQQLEAGLDALDALKGFEALCCFVTEDERPLSGAAGFVDWRLCGELALLGRKVTESPDWGWALSVTAACASTGTSTPPGYDSVGSRL